MGKYRNRNPNDVADKALNNLLNKIPQMITDYTNAMNKFKTDEEAQARYVRGVAMWTSVMRNEETRLEIANAVARAKARYRNMVTPGGYATIPVTVQR